VFLIWGFRSRAKTMSEGTFFCPKCGADRGYVLQTIRRWFTLFFIPVAPIGKVLAEQVKCTTCNTCYRPAVLTTPTSAQLTASMTTATRVAVVAAGNHDDHTARAAAVQTITEGGEPGYDDAQLTNDLVHGDLGALPAYLAPLADGLTLPGKERFVWQVVSVARADGAVTAGERQVIDSIGAALGLSAAHVEGIVASGVPIQPES
jgi:hypothetical protein